MGSVTLHNNYRLTGSSVKKIEEIDNAHVKSLMCILISSKRHSHDLSITFHRSIEARERDLTINKTTKEKIKKRFSSNDVFGFAGHQENAAYDLRYKLTFERNSGNYVLGHPAGTNGAANLAMAGETLRIYQIKT